MRQFKIFRHIRHRREGIFVVSVLLMTLSLMSFQFNLYSNDPQLSETDTLQKIMLPDPVFRSEVSVEEAIHLRRSVRTFAEDSLSLNEIAQLLWAAQGVTSSSGKRTVPSAGGLYPLEIYIVCDAIKNVPRGSYHYLPNEHALEKKVLGELIPPLYRAAMFQPSLNRAAGIIVITAVFKRTTKKYESRGERYIFMEAGHAAQNICLQSVSLGIGTVTVGSFKDSSVAEILQLSSGEYPLYLMPIGKTTTK